MVRDSNLKKLLWDHQNQGGFESALADLQSKFIVDPASGEKPLQSLQAAISRMFEDMNAVFMTASDWQFGQQDIERQIGTFLTRFDAIFTLNQDLLLEHHYTNENIKLIGKKKHDGAELPGMLRKPSLEPFHSDSWSRSIWSPMDEEAYAVSPRHQPIYKLHGSSNWTHTDNRPLLIMGDAKVREIGQTPILNWYASEFDRWLSRESSKLMVIGYGFGDDHINEIIVKAVASGLKLFIIDPHGAALGRRVNHTRQLSITLPTQIEMIFEKALIGASRRSLREIFSYDKTEFNKIMRFFNEI